MYIKDENIFFTVLVLGPKNLKDKIDVFLKHLNAGLNDLWTVWVEAYDITK